MKEILNKDTVQEIAKRLEPINTKSLFVHENVKKMLIESMESNSTHHAICLYGNKGIGKATTIYNSLKEYASKQENKLGIETSKIIESTNHPDIITVKPENEGQEISIDQVRKAIEFSFLKPSSLKKKYIIIDSIDSLNKNSANAILKVLEEPSKSNQFFLVCHNKSSTVKTILSRCMFFKCKDPSEEEFYKIFNLFTLIDDDDLIKKIGKLGDFNPYNCLMLYLSGGIDIYQEIISDICNLRTDSVQSFKTLQDLNLNSIHLAKILFTKIIIQMTKISTGSYEEEYFEYIGFEKLLDLMQNKLFFTPIEMTKKLSRLFEVIEATKKYNMSLKHAIFVIIHIIRSQKDLNLF